MERILTDILVQLAGSHQQLARILDAERQVTVRMSELVQSLPDANPELNGLEGMLESSVQVNKSVIGYLNGLAELQESVADSLKCVIQAIREEEDEE